MAQTLCITPTACVMAILSADITLTEYEKKPQIPLDPEILDTGELTFYFLCAYPAVFYKPAASSLLTRASKYGLLSLCSILYLNKLHQIIHTNECFNDIREWHEQIMSQLDILTETHLDLPDETWPYLPDEAWPYLLGETTRITPTHNKNKPLKITFTENPNTAFNVCPYQHGHDDETNTTESSKAIK